MYLLNKPMDVAVRLVCQNSCLMTFLVNQKLSGHKSELNDEQCVIASQGKMAVQG